MINLLGLLAIFFAGLLSGLLGVGGGVLLIPILMYCFHRDVHTAVATSLAVIIPTAVAGALIHWTQGKVDIKLFILCACFAVCGAILGAWFCRYVPPLMLKRIFAVVLVLIAVRLFFDRGL